MGKKSFRDKIVIALCATTAVLCVAMLVPNLQNVAIKITEIIFGRTLDDYAKWQRLISSLVVFTIFLDCIFFCCYFKIGFKSEIYKKNAAKLILLLIACVTVLIVVMHMNAANVVDSDDAGEMMLWRECVIEKSLMPRGWFYSTEIRILNTQIFGAIFFLLFSNWTLIKLLVSLCSIASLFFATFFLMERADIKDLWKKEFCSLLVILPSSMVIWKMMTFGNYYIPHIVISFIYVALFIDLQSDNVTHKKLKKVLFFLLAFFGGLASIRYLLTILFPFAIMTLWNEITKIDVSTANIKIILKNKMIAYGICGLVVGCVGYIGNLILNKIYQIENYMGMTFASVDEINLFSVIKYIPQILGYKGNVNVFSVSGLVNIFVFIFIILFVVFILNSTKVSLPTSQKIIINFFVINFIFNTFIFFAVGWGLDRFYLPITAYIIPCAFIFIFDTSFNKLKRLLLGSAMMIMLFASTFSVAKSVITDRSSKKTQVANFLKENYTFGYGTFWNAAVFAFLTNGNVDVANLNTFYFSDSELYEAYEFLSPHRYYEAGFKNDEKIFFVVTQDEFYRNMRSKIFETGKHVYEDEFYRVYEYKNHEAFKNGF